MSNFAADSAIRAGNPSNCPPSRDFFQAVSNASSGLLDKQHGFLRLAAGHAVTLKAAKPGVLRIAQGRVWATFDHSDRVGSCAGDFFAGRGEGLPLLPGQAVVVESFALGEAENAYFSWEPLAPAQACRAAPPAQWALG